MGCNCDREVVLPGATQSLGPKFLVELGDGLRLWQMIGLGEINILWQDRFAHTCANSPIWIHHFQ